jgi:hypothetical protein
VERRAGRYDEAEDMKRVAVLACASWLACTTTAFALVKYDQGQRTIDGIQLLQDANDPLAYYYIPQYPRLATKSDGSFELLCLKYVDAAGGASGGLFHALIEFSLPQETIDEIEKKLRTQVPGARIVGAVPLMQALESGEEGIGSFQIVSAILKNRETGPSAGDVITSGRAPLTPGSKAVVAAMLNPQAATLLWDSLSSQTSDVSVAIRAYYEAAVTGYNARVTAEVEAIYTHFSRVLNQQEGYTRRHVRNVVDDLQRKGDLKIEVLDRSAGLGIKPDDMAGILQTVTDKLVELMFDSKTGWAADPPREAVLDAGQIKLRQQRGFFGRLFGGSGNQAYYTDNQYVLKNRKDVRRNVFTLTLSKNSTIKVPVDTAGNLGGLYSTLKEDSRYFRLVDLSDPAFEFRPVHFQVDGDYVDAFQDTINFVSVNFRKSYPDRPAFTKSLHFTHAEMKAGKTVQDVAFPRLAMTGANWPEYEYQVRWSVRDGETVSIPAGDTWATTRDAAVSLVPPFSRRVVEIDADRQLFTKHGYATAVVEFATMLGGKPRLQRKAILRAADAAPTTKVAVYHDRQTPIAVRVTWHSPTAKAEGKLEVLESDYLFLSPPAAASSPSAAGGGR